MGIIDRDGALYMATGIDNSGLYSGLNQAEGRIDQFGNHISAMGDKITRLTGIGFGIAGFKAFGDKIVDVRGEMQLLETSFGVLLGNEAKANKMLSEIKEYNIQSPLSLNGISQAAQLLLGFNVEAEKVMPTLKQLGDISMGDTGRFQSLALAFAQMSAAGKLMGQDLLQMINAGFNPLQEISKNTGKSLIELRKEMENGAISSEMVAQAFASATAQGGKFYGMTEKQAEGIKGLQAKLEGGLIDAFNQIGKSQEGLIAGGYKVSIALIENYQAVGEALSALIATYGLYKAAMVFDTAIDKTVTLMRYDAEIAELTKLLPLKEQEANADLKTAVASGKLTQAKADQIAVLRAEIESRRESIQSKLAEEQINLKYLEAKRLESVEAIKLAQAKTAAAKEELANAIATAEGEKIASLQKKMGLESERQSRAALRIVKLQDQKAAAIDQARALQEKGASDIKVASKQREIASIQAKIAAAREEEIQHGRNVAAARSEIKAGVDVTTNKNIQTLSNKINTLSEKENVAATVQTGYAKQIVGKRVLIKKIATDAETISNQINTAEQNINTTSTNFLAVAKNRAALAAKNLWAALAPNPYVLAAAAVVALAYGIYKLATAATAAEQAQSALNKQSEETARKADDERSAIEKLLSIIKDDVSTRKEKQKALDTLQSNYPSIFKNLDAEKIKNLDLADAIRQVNIELEKRAGIESKANVDRAKEILSMDNFGSWGGDKEIADAEKILGIDGIWDRYTMTSTKLKNMLEEYVSQAENKLLSDAVSASKANFNILPKNEKISSLKKDVDNLQNQYNRLKKLDEEQKNNPFSGGLSLYAVQLEAVESQINAKNAQIKTIEKDTEKTVLKNKAYWEKIRDDQQKVMDSNLPDSNIFKLAQSQRDEAAKQLEQWNKTNFKSQESATQKMRDASLKLLNLQAELDNESVKQQLDNEQKLLDIEQDSFDKRYRQNQLNAAKEFLAVEEYRQKMAKAQQDAAKDIYIKNNGSDKGFNFASYANSDLEKMLPSGLKPSDIEAQAKKTTDAWVEAWKKGNADIAKELEDFADEENLAFSSQLDQQIYTIRKHYRQRRIEAGKNTNLIKVLNTNETKEILAARLQAHQRQLEADADYNQKYLELTSNRFLFEADKRKAALKQQIEDQKKIINSIKGQLRNDPFNIDLSNQLRNARINLKGLENDLRKAPADKLMELVGYANQLSDAFGESTEALSEALDLVGSVAQGFAQGGWIGGAVALATNIIDSAVKKSEQEEQTKRNLLKLQYELNKELREQNYNLIESVDYSRVFADNIEALLWLVEKGFISDKQYSVWTALFAGKEEAKKNLDTVQKEYDDFIRSTADKLNVMYDASQKSMGGIPKAAKDILNEWKSGAIETEKAIRKLSEVQGTGGFKESLDILNSLNGELDKYTNEFVELMKQMEEFATGTSFDSFLSDASNAIKDLRGNILGLADFTEETLTNAILSSFKYQVLSDALKPMYNELADMFLKGDFDSSMADDWKKRLTDILNTNSKELDKIFASFGVDPDNSSNTSQSSSRGGFETITQDQAGSIDGRLTGIHENGLNILSILTLIQLDYSKLKEYGLITADGVLEIKQTLMYCMDYLANIAKSNNELYQIREDIAYLRKNGIKIN